MNRVNRRRFLKILGGGGVLLTAATSAHAHWIEPHQLEITQHDVQLPHLPRHFAGLKIAQISDLHRGPVTPDAVIVEAIRRVALAQPDLIVVTGDFIHEEIADGFTVARMLARLRAPLGVWGCLGNHDYSQPDQLAKILENRGGIQMLRNQSAPLGDNFWIAGIEDTVEGRPDAQQALANVPDNAATIFLSHNPVGVLSVQRRSCLTLSGHTHGGQIRLPGLPPHAPAGMDGFPLLAGWGRFGDARLYINRGIGMTGIPFRLGARPEVTVFRLYPA